MCSENIIEMTLVYNGWDLKEYIQRTFYMVRILVIRLQWTGNTTDTDRRIPGFERGSRIDSVILE